MSPHEFDCRLCGRHIISIGFHPLGLTLCATCSELPGWHLDPELRKRFDPDFDAAIDAVPTFTPEEFMNFELHQIGIGHVPVHELLTLEQLKFAYAAQGEAGMWQLARVALLRRGRDAQS